MKKVLLSGIVGSLLLTSANADIVDRGHFGISLGSIKFENADAGASVGFISKFEKNVFGDLYFGLGTNLEIFDASNISDEDLGILADIYPIITYDITKNISVNGSYAYTAGYLSGNRSDNGFDGTTAGVGIAYKFSNGFEIEAKYKHSSLEWTNDIKFDADRVNLAFNFRFGK
ncbi:hypothetical protein ACOL3B_09450 [Aliarcobacter butzleri]